MSVPAVALLAAGGGCEAGGGGRDDRGEAAPVPAPSAPPRDRRLTSTVPPELVEACRAAARRYAGTLYCPPVVPVGPLEVSYAGPVNRRRNWVATGFLLDLGSPSLRRRADGRRDRAAGHWTVAGGTDPSLGLHLGPGRRERRRVAIGDRRVAVYRMPSYEEQGGFYADHVVADWSRAGVRYQVTVHSPINRGAAIALARALIHLQQRCARSAGAPGCELAMPGGG